MLLGIINEIRILNAVINILASICRLKTSTQMSNNCVKKSSDKNHKEEVVKLGYYLGVVGGGGKDMCGGLFSVLAC